MPVIAMFYVIPIHESPSASHLVAEAVKVIKGKGFKYQVTPAATIFEASSVSEALNTIAEAVEAVKKLGVKRVIVGIKLDERLDKPLSMEEMVSKVEKML